MGENGHRKRRKRKRGCTAPERRFWRNDRLCFAAGMTFLCVCAGALFFSLREGDILSLSELLKSEARETVHVASRQEADFPELMITVEDVEGDFYYQQLTQPEQTVYRELLQGVQTMEKCIFLHAGKGDHPEKVYETLLYDRAELFYCDGSSRMTVYEDYTEFYPGYTCSLSEKEEREKQIEKAYQNCAAGVGSDFSEYDRIQYVYEYIVNTVDYDEYAPDNQNIYSALVGKRSVCAGYSRAAQYLLGKMGIECIYVVGTVRDGSPHAWNIVRCDGKYYQMDVTFADPVYLSEENLQEIPADVINYDYLCCTDAQMFLDHIPAEGVPYPECASDDRNYYKSQGMYYTGFDPQILLGAMNDSICAGEQIFVCKFSEEDVFNQARNAMVEDLIPKAAGNLALSYGLDHVKYTYAEDKTHYKITVCWNYE